MRDVAWDCADLQRAGWEEMTRKLPTEPSS